MTNPSDTTKPTDTSAAGTPTTDTAAVVPMLYYEDVVAAARWLGEVFGLETTAEHPGPDGTVVGVEMRIGAGRVMLLGSPEDAELGMTSPRTAGRATGGVYVALDDPAVHHAAAKDAGATIVLPLREMAYDSVEYGALDLEGHYWGFGTYRLT